MSEPADKQDDCSQPLPCANCGGEPHDDENPDDEWRAYSDGVRELVTFCPECAKREFDLLTLPTSTTPEDEALDDELIAKLFVKEDPAPRVIGGFVTSSMRAVPSEELVQVDVIRVSVFLPADLTAAEFEDEERMDWRPMQRRASDVLWSSLPVARGAVGQFLDWVRVAGQQHWLEA